MYTFFPLARCIAYDLKHWSVRKKTLILRQWFMSLQLQDNWLCFGLYYSNLTLMKLRNRHALVDKITCTSVNIQHGGFTSAVDGLATRRRRSVCDTFLLHYSFSFTSITNFDGNIFCCPLNRILCFVKDLFRWKCEQMSLHYIPQLFRLRNKRSREMYWEAAVCVHNTFRQRNATDFTVY